MKTLAYVLMDNFCPCFVTEVRKFVNLFQTTRVTNNIFMKDPPPLFALIFLRKKARYKENSFHVYFDIKNTRNNIFAKIRTIAQIFLGKPVAKYFKEYSLEVEI